jgi:iron complex outermembrane receptor protein
MLPHRPLLLAGAALAPLLSPCAAAAQIALPEVVVRAPSPIAQTAPSPNTTAPADGATLLGTLPIVTGQFATVTVVRKQELERSGGATLGDVLFDKPGITGSSFAPGAASRPVIRGLDNNRVRIQENGLGVSDMSDVGEDHGVSIDPLAAQQIEVIRGPATLRYGSQAIGGVVNVDNNRIPTALPPRGFSAEINGAFNSVDRGIEGGVLLDAGKGNFALHADAYGRRTGDYGIPGYPYLFPETPAPAVDGRQPNSATRSHGQALGGSYLFDGGFIGLAISQFSNRYNVPGMEAAETRTSIDMKQSRITSKGEFRPQSAAVDAVRFWLSATDYKHHEIADEGGFYGIQQTFTNRAQEARVETQFAPFDLRFAALTTALGVQASNQNLDAPGIEGGLFDSNRTRSIAGYVFNELAFADTLKAQLSGRIEQVNVSGAMPDLFVDPDTSIARGRSFTPASGAVGLIKELPFGLAASVTAQYVERAPRGPELFSRGVHEATGTFDIGNPDLGIETAKSVEIGLRRAAGPVRFEATAYYTHFNNFIYRNLTGAKCDEDFASCGVGGGTELNQAIYSQRNATFKGAEIQAQWDIAPAAGGMFGIDGQYDIVQATFDDGSYVPRIPPQRLGGGMYFRSAEWFARVGLLHAFAQNHIAAVETPTDGYNLLKAELSYTRKFKNAPVGEPREITVGIVGNNLLNENIRNAVSFKKDEVLMPGRTVRLFASMKF